MATTTMTPEPIRRLLVQRGIPVPAGDDGPLVLDSLDLAWLLYSLMAEADAEFELADDAIGSPTSVRAIAEAVTAALATAEV